MTQLDDALAALALQPDPVTEVRLDHTWLRDVVAVLQAAGVEVGDVRDLASAALTRPPDGDVGDVLTLEDVSEAGWRPLPTGSSASGTGGAAGYHVIAPSDATAADRAAANEVAPGVDDQIVINAALAAHRRVRLTSGTFHCSATVGLDADEGDGGGYALVGSGRSTVLEFTDGTIPDLVRFGGSILTDASVITGPVEQSSSTLTIPEADAALYAPGDWCVLRADAKWSTTSLNDVNSEWVQVRAVSGATLTLHGRTVDAYTGTGIRLDRYRLLRDVRVSDLAIAGPGATTAAGSQNALTVFGCLDPRIDGVAVSACRSIGVRTLCCVGGTVDRILARDIQRTDGTLVGYGVDVVGCLGTVVSNVLGIGNRHTLDVHGGQVNGGIRTPISRDIIITSCRAIHDSSAGISTHVGSDGVTIADCVTYMCAGGIIVRGRGHTVRGCRVLGHADDIGTYTAGLIVGDGGDFVGIAGQDLIVEGNTFDLRRQDNDWVYGLDVNSSISSARIAGNVFRGFVANLVRSRGTAVRGLDLVDNTIDGGSMRSDFDLLALGDLSATGTLRGNTLTLPKARLGTAAALDMFHNRYSDGWDVDPTAIAAGAAAVPTIVNVLPSAVSTARPVEVAELRITSWHLALLDLAPYDNARLSGRITNAGNAGLKIGLQFSLTGVGGWAWLSSGTGVPAAGETLPADANGVFESGVATIAAAARGQRVTLRAVTIDGDGTTTVSYGQITMTLAAS